MLVLSYETCIAFRINHVVCYLCIKINAHCILHICVGCQIYQFNTLRLRQNDRHFPDAIFKCIFLDESVSISINISLEFIPKIWINNIRALVQIMAWHRPGDKELSEPMMVSLLMYMHHLASMSLHNEARTKWLPFFRKHFHMHL